MSGDFNECGHQWEPREGETITYRNEFDQEVVEPARGPHCCIKKPEHIHDITDDDHKCCCGNSDWITP